VKVARSLSAFGGSLFRHFARRRACLFMILRSCLSFIAGIKVLATYLISHATLRPSISLLIINLLARQECLLIRYGTKSPSQKSLFFL
jgi:hypothetical protein